MWSILVAKSTKAYQQTLRSIQAIFSTWCLGIEIFHISCDQTRWPPRSEINTSRLPWAPSLKTVLNLLSLMLCFMFGYSFGLDKSSRGRMPGWPTSKSGICYHIQSSSPSKAVHIFSWVFLIQVHFSTFLIWRSSWAKIPDSMRASSSTIRICRKNDLWNCQWKPT